MRDSDVADRRAGPGDPDRRAHRLARAHTFERRVDADTVGHLLDLCDRVVAALGDDVGGAEGPCEILAVPMAAHGDYPLGAEAPGGQHGGEAYGAVADDGHHIARPDP